MTQGDRSSEIPRRTFLAGTGGVLTLTTGQMRAGAIQEEEEDDQPSKPTSYDVTARDGLRLRVWERTPEDPDEAVLFVHGATYGGVSMFDPPVAEEYGWMDFAVERGQAAYALDIRGYGESELPPEFEEPPEANTPVLSLCTFAGDVNDVLQFVRDERGFDRVHLVGLSLGTWTTRALFNIYDPQVATVTLAAGSFRDIDVGHDPEGPAYSTQTREEFLARWNEQIPEEEDRDQWIGGDRFTAEEVQSAVWRAIYETNQAIDDDPETILAPHRVVIDEHHPEDINLPTLVIRGSSDPTITREGALQLYDAVGATEHRKRYIEIAGGTHFIFLESRRRQFYDATHNFQSRY